MSEELVKIEPVLQQIQTAFPQMTTARDKAVAAMKGITQITSDEELEAVNGLLVKVRTTHSKVQALRKPITEIFDELKKHLMAPEADLDQDKPNEVARLRGLISKYNQQKIDAKKAAEAEAAKIKEKENHKVDIATRIKKNLADMIINRVKEVHVGSSDFWKKATLETFDGMEKTFMTFRIALKTETFNKCFDVPFNSNLLTKEEFEALLVEVGAQETYLKWDQSHTDAVTPVVNEWRGKISQIKADLIALKSASDESSRAKIAEEQAQKSAQEDQRRQQQIANMQHASDNIIQQSADIGKMHNEFREQAMVQTVEDAGPVKLILKFKDEKPVQALVEIIYHCFKHEKFPSIVKKNKDGSDKLDENGFPIYTEGIDFFVKFFIRYCDVNISGVEIKEVSKVVVRK